MHGGVRIGHGGARSYAVVPRTRGSRWPGFGSERAPNSRLSLWQPPEGGDVRSARKAPEQPCRTPCGPRGRGRHCSCFPGDLPCPNRGSRGCPGSTSASRETRFMAKQMVFETDARDAIRRGVDKLAKAVTTTLGTPRAQCRARQGLGRPDDHQGRRDRRRGDPAQDPYEHMGAQLVKEVASKTSDVAGDGTTTATAADRRPSSAPASGPMTAGGSAPASSTSRDARKARDAVTAELEKLLRKVRQQRGDPPGRDHLGQQRPAIGKLIATRWTRSARTA